MNTDADNYNKKNDQCCDQKLALGTQSRARVERKEFQKYKKKGSWHEGIVKDRE